MVVLLDHGSQKLYDHITCVFVLTNTRVLQKLVATVADQTTNIKGIIRAARQVVI